MKDGASAGDGAPSPWDDLALVAGLPPPGSMQAGSGPVDLSLEIGEGGKARRLVLPLVLTDDSDGKLSPRARLALVQVASRKGCALRLEDPTPDLVELAGELEVPLWLVVGPRRTAPVVEALGMATVVELQVADVDVDGTLTTAVDARDGEGSMEAAVSTLRSVTDGAAVAVNVGPISDREVLRHAASSGADAIMVRAASSRTTGGHVGPGPVSAIAGMRRAIARTKLPEGAGPPMISAYGGINDGVQMVKAMALGASVVVMGTPLRIAMGCTLCDECGPGDCPAPREGETPDWRSRAEDLVAFVNDIEARATGAMARMGCRGARDLSLGNLEARTYDAAAVTGVALTGYGETLPMWHH